MKSSLYEIDEGNIIDEIVGYANNLYLDGKVFIYPTDTIYGIGGNPFNKNVVERINQIKGRNTSKNFIYLINSFNLLYRFVDDLTQKKKLFLQKIWPSPISVVINLNSKSSKLFDSATACFRMPENFFCKKILTEIGGPLISTSVNKSNEFPLSDVNKIVQNYSDIVDAIFYTKKSISGTASTIIDLTGEEPKIIREGTIKFIELFKKFK